MTKHLTAAPKRIRRPRLACSPPGKNFPRQYCQTRLPKAIKSVVAASSADKMRLRTAKIRPFSAASTDFIALGRRVWQYCLGNFLPGGEQARRGRRIRFGAAVRCFVTKWGYCAWNSVSIRGYWEEYCSRNLQMIQPRIQNPVLVLELRFKWIFPLLFLCTFPIYSM